MWGSKVINRWCWLLFILLYWNFKISSFYMKNNWTTSVNIYTYAYTLMITKYLQRKADNFWLFDVNFGSSGKLAKLLLADILFIREIECVQTKHTFFQEIQCFTFMLANYFHVRTVTHICMHRSVCMQYAVGSNDIV